MVMEPRPKPKGLQKLPPPPPPPEVPAAATLLESMPNAQDAHRETGMDVKEAVQAARAHVSEIFAGEMLTDVGLEEVTFDHEENLDGEISGGVWAITIGFSRPWDDPNRHGPQLGEAAPPRRTYMTVRIHDATGKALELTRRALD